jgi:Cu(I)/Ag(I) efflux system membrane fusion protein
MNKQLLMALALTAFLVALGLGFGFAGRYWYESSKKPAPQMQSQSSEKSDREILFYRNPMNPAITSPTPAQDEMGMDYIPVYADGGSGKGEPAGTVQIDPITVQNIGVRTAIAKKQVLSRNIRAVGRVDYNEKGLSRIHPKIEGWVNELNLQKTGEQAEKDDVLLSIYSPQLVASQQEYLLALENLETLRNNPSADIRQGAAALAESARMRLELFDVPAQRIEELSKDKMVKKNLPILSPFAGIVMNIGVRVGDYVSPKTELYMLADLSQVWVYVEVYENELPWVSVGDPAEMTVAAVPGKVYQSKVAYIYPYVEKKTRTVTLRLELDNKDGKLKPDMFADVVLKADRQEEAVVVPAEAVVRTGNRVLVFVQRQKGKFEPREVELGIAADGLTQINSGLEAGEVVVTSGQFLIDSESKLREATAKMLEIMGAAGTAADQAEMDDMDDMDMSDFSLEDDKGEGLDMQDMNLENE